MRRVVSRYTRERLETNYITAIWIIRILFVVNIVFIYKIFF